jgi:cytochrome oxidase Cu insertion factor (SCO1/SenC/PrrC family)
MDWRPKHINSKAFLLLYLVVIGCLLSIYYFSRLPDQKEYRTLPAELASFLVSPPRAVPQFLLFDPQQRILTEQSLKGKWSLIYFTQPSCLPTCEAPLTVLNNLQGFFAANSVQIVLINFDANQFKNMKMFSSAFTLYGSQQQSMLDDIASTFHFLYLKTDYPASTYTLEQQESIFLVDPKTRVYARFEPPYSSAMILDKYYALRDFYARSE